MLTRPMSPVRATWVPPQSSTEKGRPALSPPGTLPIDTTRTSSPYFSPNKARAPESIASSTSIRRVTTGSFCKRTRLAMSSTSASSLSLIGFGWAKSKRSRSAGDERPLLGDMVAEHLAQRLVQQMGGGMIGADRPRGGRDRPRARAHGRAEDRRARPRPHGRRGRRASSGYW